MSVQVSSDLLGSCGKASGGRFRRLPQEVLFAATGGWCAVRIAFPGEWKRCDNGVPHMKGELDVVPHLEDLWRYARVLTRNDADADDLVQEALVRALSLAHAYDPARPLVPWLVTIVRNTFLTGETRRRGEARRMDAFAAVADGILLPSQDHSVELAEVTRAFRALPPEQAEVLHLVGVLGFTYADTAGVLGVPAGTVMSRLSRARAALRVAVEMRTGAAPAPQLRVVGGLDGSA